MKGLKQDQIIELLGRIPFFKTFSAEEKKYFSSMDCNVYRYVGGENIIKQGDEEYALYIVLSGKIRITRDIPRGPNQKPKEIFLTRLEAGAVFGEISLLARQPRTTSAYSEGETILAKIDGDFLENLDPVLQNKINKNLISLLVQRLEDMNAQLMQFVR